MKALITILLVLPALALGQLCSVPGDCIGFSIDMQTLATEKDCLAHCKNTTNCEWYSFDSKTLTCNALFNRQTPDTSCTTCRHGENECKFPSECFVKGGCQGGYIGNVPAVPNAEECLKTCYDRPNCKWFTYLNVTRVCNMYSSCIVNENEPNMISGERECYEESNPVPHTAKVFIQHNTNTGIMTVPSANNSTGNATVCTKPPSFPASTRGAIGNVVDGSLTVCSGSTALPNCYRLNATTNQWVTFPSMLYGTMYAAEAMTSKGWWVTGGYISSTYSARTSYYNGSRWLNGTNLPSGRMDHCMTQIDESQTFMSGGVTGSSSQFRDAYIYNHNTEDWIELPDMNQTMQEHACASYRDANGTTIILVAGGSSTSTTVASFNLATRQWRRLPNLPTSALAATLVSNAIDGSDMVLVNTYYGNAMRFNKDTETFTRIQSLTLPVTGDYSTVVSVTDEQLSGCQ